MLKARRPKVNHFDPRLIHCLQEDVLRLEVAVDDLVLPHVGETDQDLDGEASDQVLGDALEVVVFDEFVEVDGEHFEGDAEMVSPEEVFAHFDDVFVVVGVVDLEVF